MTLNTCSNIHLVILRYQVALDVIHKNEINLKTGNWNLFSQNFDVIKKGLGMFLIFSVMEHVDIKFSYAAFWKMRELPLYTICQLIVKENRCFDTAERIQIMKMNIRDLNNNNLKSTCYYKYLIRLL